MAKDYLGLRGFAQVVPTTNSNLYALANLAQRSQAHKDDMLQKKQAQDQTWFDEQSKLGFPKVRSELSQGMKEVLNSTYQGMSSVYQTGMSANRALDPREKQAIGDMRVNYDSFKGLAESFDGDLTKVEDLIKNDKEKVFNQPVFAGKLKSIIDNTFERDASGKIVSIDPLQSKKLSELTNDPDIYDDAAVAKQYISQLGQAGVEQVQNNGSYFQTNKQEFTNGLYETNKDGSMKLDKNTGLPLPKASGESIMMWDSDPIRKAKLDRYAQSITKEGQPWEKNRGKAFEKFVVDKYGTFKENKTVTGNSAYNSGDAEANNLANNRYTEALRPAVYNYDNSALAQTFSGNDRTTAVFTDNGGEGNLNDEAMKQAQEQQRDQDTNKPKFITVYRREVVQPNPYSGDMSQMVKYSDWVPFAQIPIGDDKSKEAALFKLNTLMDEAGGAKNSIGNDKIRTIHNKFTKTAPKNNGGLADNY